MMRPFIIPFLISCWVLALPGLSYAQDCDCAGSGNCPATIPTNSSGEICFDVTDALNNDLANPDQGVCGVEITFTHQHIWDLELWLVSPGGDTVQLMGPNINVFGTTNSVLWDVTFIPCSVAPIPDTVNGNALEEIWTNDQNWPFGGFISGTYLPYDNNCLESFDFGPANGQWCLLYENNPSTYTGDILNFEVILCDQTGIQCCDAEAGSLSAYPDIELCEGNAGLLLDIPPDFLLGEPDTLEYGYTYIISDQNGVILEYDSIPDLRDDLPGIYTVCGYSYRLEDSLNIPAPDGIMTVQDLLDYMLDDVNMLCGDINNNCIEVTIVAPPVPVNLQDTICDGDVYMIGDTSIFDAGNYSLIFQTAAECDSIVNLDLTVLPLDTTNLAEVVCADSSYTVGATVFDQTGVYEVLLSNTFGCDSLVILELEVLTPIQTDLIDTICIGETYTIGTTDFNATGNYQVTLQTSLGCDSLVTLDLTVLDLEVLIATPDTITCFVPDLILDGAGTSTGDLEWTTLDGQIDGPLDQITTTVSAAGTYYLTVTSAGCSAIDSIVVLANNDAPIIDPGQMDTLTCIETSVQLDGTNSEMGMEFEYLWTTLDGNIVQDPDGLQPIVDAPGIYYLEITNTLTGCTSFDSVEVVDNQIFPLADAGPDGVLTCLDPIYTLDGSNSYNLNFIMDWDDANGDDIVWFDELQAPVSIPGWYFLIITDPVNGCVSIDSVEVSIDQNLPQIDIEQPDTLTCVTQEVLLDATASDSGPGISGMWSTVDGMINGNPNNELVFATANGTYYYTLLNNATGCENIDSVLVSIDTISPMVSGGNDIDLNCGLTQIAIGVPDSTSQGPEFLYQWLDGTGAFLSDALQFVVDQSDTYVINVININNGCTATDTVLVTQSQVVPVADSGTAGPLTCDMALDTLGGPNSSVGVFIEYEWYLDDQLVGTDMTLTVGLPGNYCLIVTNGNNLCADTACTDVLADATLPIADAGPDQALDCVTGSAILDGNNSTIGPNITYSWSGTAPILTDPTLPFIEVDGLGAFYLTVSDEVNDCFTIDSVITFIDTAACMPFAAAGLPGLINCYNFPNDTLDASASDFGPQIEYNWTAISGTIVDGADTPFPIVTSGEYALEVINTVLNLSAFDTVLVSQDLAVPVAQAGPGFVIDCSTLGDDFNLDGTGTSVGPQYIYYWTDINGEPLIGGDGLMPLINTPGIYSLEVTDTINGCSSSDAVLIGLDGSFPAPCLVSSFQIGCDATTALLGDTCFANHPDYIYEWTVDNGVILSNPMDPVIEVDPESPFSTLYLTVTDPTNSCTTTDSIIVFPPVACFPDCEVVPPPDLTCDLTEITLDASGSSVGPEYSYSWTTLDGNLCGAANTLFPCVDAPGTYQLVVTNTNNQFSCTTEVEVFEDIDPPLVEAGDAAFLTCSIEELQLDATATLLEASDQINWLTPGSGCIVSGADGLEPLVACAGWYYLTVTDGLNGCTATDSVLIEYDTLAPIVQLAMPSPLSCTNNPAMIDGAGSVTGPAIFYNWYLDGVLVNSGFDLISIEAGVSGIYCLEVLDQNNGCSDSLCVELTSDDDLPMVDAGSDQVLTCIDTNLTLTGTAPAGAEYQYLWTATNGGCILTDPTLISIDIACIGTYTLTVTNTQNGCFSSDFTEVTEDTNPPLTDAGPDQTLTCLITTVPLDGSGSDQSADYIYSWSALSGNISGLPDALISEANMPGIYVLSITDLPGGCVGFDTVVVSENLLLPVADAGADQTLTCAITTLELDGSGTSQGDSLVYSWEAGNGGNIQSGEMTLTPLVSSAGTYVINVLDTLNGCAQTDTVIVGLDVDPPTAMIDSTEVLQLNCNITSLQLLGSGSLPFGELTYFWETTDGNITSDPSFPDIFIDSSGLYTFTVESTVNGCLDTLTVEVAEDYELPIVFIQNPDNLTCEITSVQLDGSGSSQGPEFNYLWEAPVGSASVILDEQSLQPTVFDPLVFTLTVTNADNGCSASEMVSVDIDTIPPVAIALAPDAIDCDYPVVGVSGVGSTAGAGINYVWSGPGVLADPTALEIEVDMPGWYSILVRNDANGCTAEDSVEVLAFALPIYGALLDIDSASCFGISDGSIVLDSVIGGSPPYLTSLDGQPFETYTEFYYLEPGPHSFSIMDINGCEWTSEITIGAGNDLMVSLGPDIDLELGSEATLLVQLNIPVDQLDTLYWDPVPDLDCPDCLEVTVSPTENTGYSIFVKDLKGCISSDQVYIRVNSDLEIYFPNAFHPNGDGANDLFFPMAGPQIKSIDSFQIFDRWGNLVHEATDFSPNDPSFGWDGQFEGQLMNPGVFVFVALIISENGSQKLIKGDVLLIR